jgi:hypothetical protein
VTTDTGLPEPPEGLAAYAEEQRKKSFVGLYPPKSLTNKE